MLDGFDSLVLVNGLDVHGDDLAGVHIQKVLQKLVAQIRSRDIQKIDRPEDAAHLKGTAVLKRQRGGCNGILYGQPAEKILRYYLQARFVRPKVRPYKTRNYYALLMKGDDTRDSVSEKE